ncbi:MAG: aspartate kinase, partial [Flavobacteriales bacterium]
MKVFKFGGASVKDAAAVRNVAQVLKHFALDDLVIVVSAMGKTTNALEEVVWAHADGRGTSAMIDALAERHVSILRDVAPQDASAHTELEAHFR